MRRMPGGGPLVVMGALLALIGPMSLTAQSQHVTTRGMQWTASAGPLSSVGTVLVIDSLTMTGVGIDPALCANACFALTYAQSTVPYYSLDVARNVTLRYSSALAAPRPVIIADVHMAAGNAKTVKEYWLQATNGGVSITFLNGDTKLRFTAPSPQTTEVRLAGQFDARSVSTSLMAIVVTITAVYTDNTTQTETISSRAMNVNGMPSAVGRGWIVGGVQKLYVQDSTYIMITNGDGSSSWFRGTGGGAYTTEADGDFTLLSSTGSGTSLVYTRTYADSSRIQFDYLGRELRAITSQSDTTSFGYDASSRLTQIYDPYRTYSGGASRSYITLHYTASGLLDQIQEPGGDGTPGAGRVTAVTISTSDSTLTAIQDPDGTSTTFGYNSNKLLTALVNRRGDTTQYAYDPNSWLVDSMISPRIPIDVGGGSTTTQALISIDTAWQTLGVPTSSTATTAATPILPSAVHATQIDPLGRKSTYTVDINGSPLVMTGPLSQTTTITRDNSWTRLPVKVVHPSGGIDTLNFTTGTPNLVYGLPAGDSARNYHYGVNGQVDSAWTKGQLALRAFLHSGTGLLDSARVGGSSSLVTHYTYDAQHRILTVADVNGHTTTYAYDANSGNVDSVTSPGGIFAVRHFDAFGRDTMLFAKGATYWVRLKYDTLNRVVKQWHQGLSNDTTMTTYDAVFPTRLLAPGGTVYKTAYNALGWTTTCYDAVDTTKFISYRYDAGGRLTSWTNRRNQRVDVVYDSVDRPLVRSGTNLPTDSMSYSTDGRIIRSTRAGVSLDSVFLNLAGMPDSIVHHLAGHRYAVQYSSALYDYGQRISDSITTDAGITFVHEAEAQRPGVTSLDSLVMSPGAGTGSTVWSANATGDITQILLAGGTPTKTRSYTVLHALASETLGSAGTAVNDSLARDYALDTLGRVSVEQRKTSTGYASRIFFYDGLGRLVKVQRKLESGCTIASDSITGQQYSCTTVTANGTVDSVGYTASGNANLPGATWTSTGNRLLTWPWAGTTYTYTYDADGNLATRARSGVTDSLFWNAIGQLDSVRSGGLRRRYEYDAAGQLVRRSTNGNWDRHFLWEGGQLVAELDSTGTHRRAQYLYHGGTDQPYAIVTDSGGSPLVRYLQQDALGNITGVIRGTQLVQYRAYTAWGRVDYTSVNTLSDTNRLRWQGLMYEADSTQLYFVRNRWYDPIVGRFISEDPAAITGGTNLYVYAMNDPINLHDPLGLCPFSAQNGSVCVDFWIEQSTVMFGAIRGDGRPSDPNATFAQSRIQIVADPNAQTYYYHVSPSCLTFSLPGVPQCFSPRSTNSVSVQFHASNNCRYYFYYSFGPPVCVPWLPFDPAAPPPAPAWFEVMVDAKISIPMPAPDIVADIVFTSNLSGGYVTHGTATQFPSVDIFLRTKGVWSRLLPTYHGKTPFALFLQRSW